MFNTLLRGVFFLSCVFCALTVQAVEIVDLHRDARFTDAVGKAGMYHPAEFKHSGIYLTQEVDASKEVVVFVHGAQGHPGEFRDIVDALDTSRYQAWVAFYPSGLRAAEAGALLAQQVSALANQHGIQHIRVLAHSFGGIVAWEMAEKLSSHVDVTELVSVATPWNGHWAARLSLWLPSAEVPSWRDLVPGNVTLQEIWNATNRPRHVLAYALTQDSESAKGDGTISRESQLASAMAEQAAELVKLVGTHTSVLHDAQSVATLVALLN